MHAFHRLAELPKDHKQCAVAIGNFDGVHLGHQQLLNRMLEAARRLQIPSAVLTFFPHPVELLHPGKKRERLFTAGEKLSVLESLGIDMVLVAQFDAALAALSPPDFFDSYLRQGLHAKSVTVGYDFRFGQGRAGDTQLLQSLCAAQSVAFSVVDAVSLNGITVSSSLIREALRVGDVARAGDLLGRPYTVSGPVVHGENRGEQIGFPTANVKVSADKCLPRDGVYVTRAVWQKQAFPSVTNVGIRPTFHGDQGTRTVEVHLLDVGQAGNFRQRLYDENISVDFLERIRDEKKFPSVGALAEQIGVDVRYARDSFLRRV